MIAVDTSSLVAFFHDEVGDDVDAVEFALDKQCLVLAPVVLTEMLSDHRLSREVATLLRQLPILEVQENFWHRAGLTRGAILKRGYKARLADTLIAQSCIDHQVALISRDGDYRHFAKYCGLGLFEL